MRLSYFMTRVLQKRSHDCSANRIAIHHQYPCHFFQNSQPLTAATECAVSELTAATSATHFWRPETAPHRMAIMAHASGQTDRISSHVI